MKSYNTFLIALIIACLSSISAGYANAGDCICDQSQESSNYGFWFEDDVIRWQEFVPTRPSLCQIDLYIHKVGEAGDILVEIKDSEEFIVWQGAIQQEEIMEGWNAIPVTPYVNLTTNEHYYIYVFTNSDSPSPNNRYFWAGQTDSDYYDGITDVESGWSNFDYCFRIFTSTDVSTEVLDLRRLLGDWGNINPDAGGLVRIVITEEAGQLVIHPYGACHPDPCDWGEAPATAYARNVSDEKAVAFDAFFDFGFSETIVTGILRRRAMQVMSFSIFKDGSGRSNYVGIERFAKSH
jgi:hypothetical protein